VAVFAQTRYWLDSGMADDAKDEFMAMRGDETIKVPRRVLDAWDGMTDAERIKYLG
jgi:hypothetical protein